MIQGTLEGGEVRKEGKYQTSCGFEILLQNRHCVLSILVYYLGNLQAAGNKKPIQECGG